MLVALAGIQRMIAEADGRWSEVFLGLTHAASHQRMLAIAILAADVAGYFRLMGADEKDRHERLRGHPRALIEDSRVSRPDRQEYRRRIPG